VWLATPMYPILFRLGPVEVSSFGAALALGAFIGYWLFARELERAGLPRAATDAAIYGLAGGLVGAKLLWVGEHFGEDRFLSLLLTRGGMSWFGGLVGGVVMGGGVLLLRGVPILPALAAATPAFALGRLVGPHRLFHGGRRLRASV
jgi:phosphatidylglycerol---prolipoprotein diacylglyceryl transferase